MTDDMASAYAKQLESECNRLETRLAEAIKERDYHPSVVPMEFAAERDHFRLENAELRSTVSGLSGLVNEWMSRASATHERLESRGVEIAELRREIDDLREQIRQYQESLRLVGQLRRAEG